MSAVTDIRPPKNPRLVEGYDGPLPRHGPVYGRRGRLPEGPNVRRYECACGKLIIRCGGDPRVAIEGYCRDCKTHVVFEA